MDLIQVAESLKPLKSGCIIFTRAIDGGGYGQVWYDGRLEKAHRIIFAMIYNITNLPSWAFICHTCDNPPCCNPNHLFLGNAEINVRDMYSKGRENLNREKGIPRAKQDRKTRANKLLANFNWNN